MGMLLIGACAAGAGAFQVHNGALPVLTDGAGRACCSARLSHRTALQNVMFSDTFHTVCVKMLCEQYVCLHAEGERVRERGEWCVVNHIIRI